MPCNFFQYYHGNLDTNLTILSEGPKRNLVKIVQAVSEKKAFKDFTILYMHTAQGQGQITPKILMLANPLKTEHTLPHYILEESNFNFRYTQLGDLNIPGEKWLNYLPTVETLSRCRVLRRLLWICSLPITLLWVSRLKSAKQFYF